MKWICEFVVCRMPGLSAAWVSEGALFIVYDFTYI